MSNLTTIAIGLIVVRLLLARQMQPRPARETSPLRIALILGVIAIGGQLRRELVSRQATFALFSNAVRNRAFWGTPLPSSASQVV
jgi:hypothetical protein